MRSLFVALSVALSSAAGSAFSQTDSEKEKIDIRIMEQLRIGTAPQVVILLDDGPEMEYINRKYREPSEATGAVDSLDRKNRIARQIAKQEDEKAAFKKLKEPFFSTRAADGIVLINDFEYSPSFYAKITDIDALLELLRNPKVKSVQIPGKVVPQGDAYLSSP